MKNLRISVRLADGGDQSFDFRNGREVVEELLSDDWAAPPSTMTITAATEDGRLVTIGIPYGDHDEVSVRIENVGEWDPPFKPGQTVRDRQGQTGTVKNCPLGGPVLVEIKGGGVTTWPLDDTETV